MSWLVPCCFQKAIIFFSTLFHKTVSIGMHQFLIESWGQWRSCVTCPCSPGQDSEPWLWMPRPTLFLFLHINEALLHRFLISWISFASQIYCLLFVLWCPSQIWNPSLSPWMLWWMQLGRGYEEKSSGPWVFPCVHLWYQVAAQLAMRCLAVHLVVTHTGKRHLWKELLYWNIVVSFFSSRFWSPS